MWFRGSCQINFEEFLEGSLRLNGAAKHFDSTALFGRSGKESTETVGSWSYFASIFREITKNDYPLVNLQQAMENHHLQ